MSDIASIVSRLIAAGTPAEVAAVAVAEAFACGAASAASGGNPVDKAAERRREYDRNRKRDERDRLRMSGGNPVDSGGSPQTVHTLPSSPEDSTGKGKKVRVRKIPCPPDWQPNENHFAKADELRITRAAVLGKAEDMRLWAQSTGALKVDWDATFHGFLRRDAEKLRGKNEAPNNVIAAADRLLERVRAFDERPGGIRDGTCADAVRLLSKG